MVFSDVTLKHLFPTPIIIASLEDDVIAHVNGQLIPLVLEKARTEERKNITNIGGWQSDTHIVEWGGEPVRTILDALLGLIEDQTMNMKNPSLPVNVDWKIYGWANVNRKRDLNVVHTHPGSFWSAIYYVQIEEASTEASSGGDLQIVDPRGVLPITYAPHLRFRERELYSCGGHELHRPQTGQCVLFPSWLPHAVTPFMGEGTRISLAFNFSI
jgi:uncharacterized protein (TIGR02466 family)